MQEIQKLDFFVIGAQKCATSWMYYCLKEHPEVWLPEDKAEVAYIGGKMFKEKGVDWYWNRYADNSGKVIKGDVSVDYLFDPLTPENIIPYSSNPKFVASLRHPTERLISSYFWLVRKGFLPDLPIEEGIKPLLDQPVGFTDKIDGPIFEIVDRGFYGQQLERFLVNNSPENMLAVLYESVSEDAAGTIRKVYSFLDIDADFTPPSLKARPKSNSYNKYLLKMERLISRKYLAGKVLAKAANVANQLLAKKETGKKPEVLSAKATQRLTELYRPHIMHTLAVLDRLPANQRPTKRLIEKRWKMEL